MKLSTNSVSTEDVRETTIAGDRHLIAEDVTFVRPMELAGGYVPEQELAESVSGWEHAPLTVRHPRDENGRVVSANTPRGKQTIIGKVSAVRANGGEISGDLAVNVERAKQMGDDAMQIVEALREGDTVEVSSQYFGDPLPSGEYDGEYREEVEGDIKPDAVALLPDGEGVCSVDDGCGFAPRATANSLTANQETGDIVRWQSAGGTAYGRVVDTIEEGQYDDEIDGDVVVTAPAALIQIYQPSAEGGWTATDTRVAHKTDNETLTVISSFPSDIPAANAATPDDASVSLRMPIIPDDGANASEGEGTETDGMKDNPTANQTYELTGVTASDVDEFTDEEWDGSEVIAELPNPSEDDDAPMMLDETMALVPQGEEARQDKANWKAPFRASPDAPTNTRALVAIKAAASGARGGFDDVDGAMMDDIEEWADELLLRAPDDLFGSMTEDGDMTGNADRFDEAVERVREFFGEPTGTTTSDFGDMSRDDMVNEISANSEFKADSVSALGDNCLARLYNRVTDNSVAVPEEQDAEEADDDTENETGDIDMDKDELREIVEETVEETVEEKLSANRERREKKEKVDSIVANSKQYEDDDRETLMSTPESVLDDIEQSVTGGGANIPSANSADGVSVEDADAHDADDYEGGAF